MIREHLAPGRPLSLYIHVPFCAKRCDYCAFYSLGEGAWDRDLVDSYYSTLSAQLCELVKEIDSPFDTIYIGGGNPILLGEERLCRLLETASRKGRAREVSMEINPENVTKSFDGLSSWLTRVSVGIQSFDGESLRILGRQSTPQAAHRALEILSSMDGLVLNADLMTNIPHRSLESSLADIETLSRYSPEHISLYSLTFEEGTRLVAREHPKSEEEEAAELERLWDELAARGYEHYEVSAFARDGHYCLHNLVYWNLGQYIGLGPSAESSVGYGHVVSSREKDSLAEYLAHPSFDSVALTKEETVEEVVMTALRTKWGIDKAEFLRRFGQDFDSIFSSRVASLEEEWYLDTPESFRLTRQGLLVLDQIIVSLFLAL